MRRERPQPTVCRLTIDRRVLLAALCAGAAAPAVAVAEPADDRPQAGDRLIAATRIDPAHPDPDAVTAAALLAPDDVTAPLIAWPVDAGARLVRTGSRLNKVLLVRLDPATLAGPTKERAAAGVVAYSAICPHAGCEVTGFIDDAKVLECPCHNSKYDPRDAAAIVEGPTTRALAALPLTIVDGKLAVARPFVGRVGIAPS